MKIRILKAWKRGAKPGQVVEMADGVANLLIRQRKAEPHESVKPSEIRCEMVRREFTQKEHDENQISETSQPQSTGRRAGNPRKPGHKAAGAADSGTGSGGAAA